MSWCDGETEGKRKLSSNNVFAIKSTVRDTCVAQSVKQPTLDFGSGHDLPGPEIEPIVRLYAQCGVCLMIVSLFLRTSPCSLSLYNK